MLTCRKPFPHVFSVPPSPLVFHVFPTFLELGPFAWRDVVAAVKLIFNLFPGVALPTRGRRVGPLVFDDAAVA